MLCCSKLLEEDEEIFEVLPKGQLNASLMVAAKILTCSRAAFSSIKRLDLLSECLVIPAAYLICGVVFNNTIFSEAIEYSAITACESTSILHFSQLLKGL